MSINLEQFRDRTHQGTQMVRTEKFGEGGGVCKTAVTEHDNQEGSAARCVERCDGGCIPSRAGNKQQQQRDSKDESRRGLSGHRAPAGIMAGFKKECKWREYWRNGA